MRLKWDWEVHGFSLVALGIVLIALIGASLAVL